MRIISITAVIIAAAAAASAIFAAGNKPDYTWPQPEKKAVENWQDMRFGMFVHWGPVSLTGREIGWSRGSQTPIDKYDQLYKKFNPVKFDADAWVRTAKAAGMKYIVLTTKHHDGFCLWPSAVTDYDIASTPFKRDVMKELAAACRKHGIRLGAYYSACDWHHPAFPLGSPGGRTKKPNPDIKAYDKYLRAQTEELITNYGPLVTIWFDVPQVYTAEYGNPMVKRLRELQPDILVNNRAYSDGRRSGFAHQSSVGDYSTPEQKVGGFDRERPWETCMTICRQWAWKPNDRMKSRKQCIQTLLQTVGGDGNLLFNVGPMPDGRIEPRQVERLKEMGEWIDKYSKAIYKTRGGPFMPSKWGAATCRDKKIYLFVMNWQDGDTLYLPAIDAKIKKAKSLSGGKVKFTQNDEGITISMPQEDQDEIATVIELKLDRDAFEITPVKVMHKSDSVAFGKKTTASNTFRKQTAQYGPAMAIDDNPETRWATDAGVKQAWLEVDLNKPTAINKVAIDEHDWNRIRKFQLQYKTDGSWKTIFEGSSVGKNFSKTFPTVTAQYVRLNILDASDGPTIWEFSIFK